MVRFDWYQATIEHHGVNDVIEAFAGQYPGLEIDHRRGLQVYGHDTHLLDAHGAVARVWHGGSHQRPNVLLSGETTMAGVEILRTEFREHLVTRADACVDFPEPDAFERIQPLALEVARTHRVKPGSGGDHWVRPHDNGRSIYLGSEKSAVRLRLYDKVAELRAKHAGDPVLLAQLPENLTRYELQSRPQTKAAKLAFSVIEPLAAMGSSTWARALWKTVANEDLEPVQVYKGWRQSDDDRAYAYCLAQYGAMLERRAKDMGWDCLGLQMRDDLAARHEAKRTRR